MPIGSDKGNFIRPGFLPLTVGPTVLGLFGWGEGTDGVLGLGNTTSYSSPVQVGGLETWDKVDGGLYFTLVTKTDGTLWAMGDNEYGQLAQGNTTGLLFSGTSWRTTNVG